MTMKNENEQVLIIFDPAGKLRKVVDEIEKMKKEEQKGDKNGKH